MAFKAWSWVLVTGLFLTTVGQALAQEEAPAAPAQAVVSAPDVVLLQNGDLFRGTIAEKLQTHTTIVLVTGETRRIPAAEIRYAGPADQLPRQATTPAAADDEEADDEKADDEESAQEWQPTRHPLYFTANIRGATLLARPQGESAAITMCDAPCKETLPEGPYTLTVKTKEEEGIVTRRQMMLNYPTNVEFTYRSRAGLRQAGAAVAVLCLLVGGAVTAIDVSDNGTPTGATGLALGITIPGLIAGVVLLSIGDAADIRTTPIGGGERSR